MISYDQVSYVPLNKDVLFVNSLRGLKRLRLKRHCQARGCVTSNNASDTMCGNVIKLMTYVYWIF